MSLPPPGDKNPEDDDLFFFESDHLALRGNRDYSDVLKTICVLEAQRKQAIEDYGRVVEIRNESLNDPLAFLEKLRMGNLQIPDLHSIPDIPQVNWPKYHARIPEQYIKQINTEKHGGQGHSLNRLEIKEASPSQPWTVEEQRKLEELLVKYPSEDVEFRRMRKIASELGTRTEKQVASRLQKYFLKLLKAGLPVPGKLPKSKSYDKMAKNKGKRANYKRYIKPSTFFPELDIPVVMNEMEEVPGPSTASQKTDKFPSNYLLNNSYHEGRIPQQQKGEMELQLELVKRIKSEKLQEEGNSTQGYLHYGFKCDFCNEDPIQGSRWHCSTCVTDSVDFCTDCMLSQLYSSNQHSLHHRMVVVRNDRQVLESACSSSESECSLKNEDLSDDSDQSDTDKSENNHETVVKIETFEEIVLEENEITNVKSEPIDEISFSVNRKYSLEVSESCPSNIFETASGSLINGNDHNEDDFSVIQNVSYDYLHSNLLLHES